MTMGVKNTVYKCISMKFTYNPRIWIAKNHILLFAVIMLLLISCGCGQSLLKENSLPQNADNSEEVNINSLGDSEVDDNKNKKNAEFSQIESSSKNHDKKATTLNAYVKLNKEVELLKEKKKSIINLVKGVSRISYLKNLTERDKKLLEGYLKNIDSKALAYDDLSQAFLIIQKGQILLLLERPKDALTFLKDNWSAIILGDHSLKKEENITSPPSAEAYFLLGNINLLLSKQEKNNIYAKQLCKDAIKSYYAVLNLYNAKDCPFSGKAIKFFRECKVIMKQRFNSNVSFPPEF